MRAMLIEVRIKPGVREKFLEAIRHDAHHSEHDEPGCLRFDVLQDDDDPNHYWYYEVYRDDDARAAHRETPHFKAYAAVSPDLLEGEIIRHATVNVHPMDNAWR